MLILFKTAVLFAIGLAFTQQTVSFFDGRARAANQMKMETVDIKLTASNR